MFTWACLLDEILTTKIDRFKNWYGDRQTKFESIFKINVTLALEASLNPEPVLKRSLSFGGVQ